MDLKKAALLLHEKNKGKFSVVSKVPVTNQEELSLAYSPGVAEPCLRIAKDPLSAYDYTAKGNLVAVVTNGTAVLGLGDIGAAAALPVMEGKAVLFKQFANVDAVPICLDSKDVDEIVRAVEMLAPAFGGINLEDIKAPECFDIEKRLQQLLNIPVFHDDQHGTAVVVLAGLINSLKIKGQELGEMNIVINGAGAAGIAICKLLLRAGAANIAVLDRKGAIYLGREGLNSSKTDLASLLPSRKGDLEKELIGADIFIGVSAKGVLTKKMIEAMNKDPIIFALANPDPEIDPIEANSAGAFIVATGRSDYPNQVNNVLGFPGIFKGALSVRANTISEGMKESAARAIASCVENPGRENIIPSPFKAEVSVKVARFVAEAAIKEGLAQIEIDLDEFESNLLAEIKRLR